MKIVVDFLLEYYVWVLVVLVILLITVIGFLADSKKKKRMREKADNENVNTEMNNINNQYPDFNNVGGNDLQMNNGFNMSADFNNNMLNQDNVLSNNGMNNIPNQNINNFNQNMEQNMNNFNQNMEQNMNNLNQNMNVGVNNFNSNVNNGNSDAFFIPASEQTPKFEPREVVIPKPVEPTPIMNNSTEVVNGWGNNITPHVEPTVVPTVNPTPVEVPTSVTPTMINPEVSIGTAPNQGPIPVPVESQNFINNIPNVAVEQPTLNLNQAPNTMPTTEVPTINQVDPMANMNVNQIPTTRPIEPTPVIMSTPNVESGNQFNNMNNVTPSPINNNTNIPNQVGGDGNNPNFIVGGSNFVVGNPTAPTDNQMPSSNDNWNL